MNRSPRAIQGFIDRAKKKLRAALARLSVWRRWFFRRFRGWMADCSMDTGHGGPCARRAMFITRQALGCFTTPRRSLPPSGDVSVRTEWKHRSTLASSVVTVPSMDPNAGCEHSSTETSSVVGGEFVRIKFREEPDKKRPTVRRAVFLIMVGRCWRLPSASHQHQNSANAKQHEG